MSSPGKRPRKQISEEFTPGPTRSKTSVYLDPLVWRAFRTSCSKVGQSTCGVLEPFMYAFSRAVSAGDYHDPRPVTVNLQVNRIVQRVRRMGPDRQYEFETGALGAPYKCFLCGQASLFHVRLTRLDPPREAYLCSEDYGYLKGRRGVLVLEIRSWTGAWVDPESLRL